MSVGRSCSPLVEPDLSVLRDPLRKALKLPAHAIYTRWEWQTRLTKVEFDITMHSDPGTSVGEYLSPFNGDIDGAQIYFGLQTDVFKPGRPDPGWSTGTTIGKGLIFSTWWSFDAKDTRIADDGYIQLGTHEGCFVGVRRPYEWGVGDYRVTLARGDADDVGDWFDLSIQPMESLPETVGTDSISATRPLPAGDSHWIGALRFKRRDSLIPATLSPKATSFLEVYGGAQTFAEIAQWHCDLQAFGDDERPVSAEGSYPTFPHGQDVPNCDTWFDASRDRVNLAFGGETKRLTPAGRLF